MPSLKPTRRSKRTRLFLTVVIGLAAIGATPGPVWSQNGPVALSAANLRSIADTVGGAINQARTSLPAGTAQAQIDVQVAQALSSTIQALIAQYGAANATAITDAVIVAANADGVGATALGQGLAMAALAVGGTVGAMIASEAGSVAPGGVVAQMTAYLTANGGTLGSRLASAANASLEIAQGPAAGPLGAGQNAGGGTNIAGGNAGPGSPCPNPSCS